MYNLSSSNQELTFPSIYNRVQGGLSMAKFYFMSTLESKKDSLFFKGNLGPWYQKMGMDVWQANPLNPS